MKKTMLVVVGGLAILSLTGCETTRICNSTGGMEICQKEGARADVRADDSCFVEWLEVESSVFTRTEAGFAIASVRIRNKLVDQDDYGREDDFALQYMFTWFDANDIELQSDSSHWMRQTLHGGEAVSLQSTAPDVSAAKYVVRIRHVR